MCPTKQSIRRRVRRPRRFREVRTGGAASAGAAPAVRRARLPEFVGLNAPAGPLLDRLRVMVIGGGSVGGEIIQHLARIGVREIWVVDYKKFKPASVATHGIPPASAGRSAAVGRYKARYWGRLAKAISPQTRVYVFVGPVQQIPITAMGRVDLVLLATDNLAAELEVGERCFRHGVPLLQASVDGSTLVAQVRYWGNRTTSGACPGCAFGTAEWAMISQETTFQCSGPDGVPVAGAVVVPTMSVSFLCSTAADLAMMQVLRHALGLGGPLEDSLVEYCGYTHRTTVSPLVRNEQCRSEHVRWKKVSLPGRLAARSLAEVAAEALGEKETPADAAFAVGDDLLWVDTVICCGWPHAVGRFAAPAELVGRCSRCGSMLVPQSFHSYRPVTAARLGEKLDRPLRKLGAASIGAVVVSCGGESLLCQEEDQETES